MNGVVNICCLLLRAVYKISDSVQTQSNNSIWKDIEEVLPTFARSMVNAIKPSKNIDLPGLVETQANSINIEIVTIAYINQAKTSTCFA